VVERAVGIAGLPIRLLTTQKAELTSQQTEMQAVNAKFSALQQAVNGIAQALDGSSFLTSTDDSGVLDSTVSQGVTEGNYSVKVSDVGAFASSLSTAAWTAEDGAVQTYKLTVGVNEYSISPADNSAASVASAINQQYGNKVRASVLNVGSVASPDYRLSLQAVKLGDAVVGVKRNGANLQTEQTKGRLASYEVQGSGHTVTSDTRTVTISTGLSVTMLSSSDTAVDITVTRSTAALTDALTVFTDAFNAAADAVDGQRGDTGGALQGQSLMQELSSALSELGTFSSADSAVSGLSDLGLDLGRDGRLTFSPYSLMAADMVNSSGINAFLGSTSGGGFLKVASSRLKSLEDVTTGSVTLALADLAGRISGTEGTIASKQEYVDRLQERLLQQMASADALVATMQQQYSYFSSMFAAMTAANQSYQ
jgi:flagellar hook-associated protein 2